MHHNFNVSFVVSMVESFSLPIVLPWNPPMKDRILSSGQPGAFWEEYHLVLNTENMGKPTIR